MKMQGQIGTLAPGAFADVSIVKLQKEKIVFEDTQGVKMKATVTLITALPCVMVKLSTAACASNR
ncbi:putative metallo-dependent hydrolase [Klebsiella grimontii]|uniref:Putative metallo-dependent hydrolase n=1 Tax=Klebsiella grimontii TaxID=2058152 RepID=A0A7H4NV34_9ENTR|nr:putative metallo-dependent hydrolase [Klebsiella grimontii]